MNIPPDRQLKACLCCSCIANEMTVEAMLMLEKDIMKCVMPYGNLHDWITNYCPIKTMGKKLEDPFITFEDRKDKDNDNI